MVSEQTTVSAPVFSIGHSTRSLEELIAMLQAHQVDQLVDVRTVPRSRRHPQFNRDSLPDSLAASGINYLHLPGLGGLRKPRPDSPNLAWRNESFRGYADYMQTEEFEASLLQLIELAGKKQVAIMCAEAVPWRCHRSLIADALLTRGLQVEHIMSTTQRQTHQLTRWAHVEGTRVSYPALL